MSILGIDKIIQDELTCILHRALNDLKYDLHLEDFSEKENELFVFL